MASYQRGTCNRGSRLGELPRGSESGYAQNLTSFGVGYFTINTYNGDGIFQKEILDAMPAVEETEFVRHVRFQHPLKVMMDGKKQEGVVILPAEG